MIEWKLIDCNTYRIEPLIFLYLPLCLFLALLQIWTSPSELSANYVLQLMSRPCLEKEKRKKEKRKKEKRKKEKRKKEKRKKEKRKEKRIKRNKDMNK